MNIFSHVIVCGHVNYEMASQFLSDFYDEAKTRDKIQIVFLHPWVQSTRIIWTDSIHLAILSAISDDFIETMYIPGTNPMTPL